jgi:hypothetical protein
MIKSLIEATREEYSLGAREKWKSWNIIVIQADSGESRIFEDAAELESKLERQRVAGRGSQSFTPYVSPQCLDLQEHARGPRARPQICLSAPIFVSSGTCQRSRYGYCVRVL